MNAQGNEWAKSEPENRVGWVFQGQYDNCEGKDSGNYTQVIAQTSDTPSAPIVMSGQLLT